MNPDGPQVAAVGPGSYDTIRLGDRRILGGSVAVVEVVGLVKDHRYGWVPEVLVRCPDYDDVRGTSSLIRLRGNQTYKLGPVVDD